MQEYCSSSTVGLANWMVINGMEADKYLCEQACQGHGGDGRESARVREKVMGHLFFIMTANPHPFICLLNC